MKANCHAAALDQAQLPYTGGFLSRQELPAVTPARKIAARRTLHWNDQSQCSIADPMNRQDNEALDVDTPQPHLRELDLAKRWMTSQRTLQRWRAKGLGPAWIKIGGGVRYRMADVVDYEHRHLRQEGVH